MNPRQWLQIFWKQDTDEPIEGQLLIVQWLLPLTLSAIVFVYETIEHIVEKREPIFSYNWTGEIGFFGVLGPAAVFLVLLWIRHEWSERARTQRQLAALHQQRGELVQKLIVAQEEERQRIAREIHDELGQLLTRLSINLKMCSKDIPPHLPEVMCQLAATETLVWQTIEQAHRLIVQLRPTLLDELGLHAALREELQHRLTPLGIETQLTTDSLPERLPASLELAVFRIAQEAISNIARHAHAHHATIALTYNDHELQAVIEDDGIGLPSNWRTRHDGHQPLGLLGMQERAALIGGDLTIEPRTPQGTRIVLRVPMNGQGDDSRAAC